MDPGAREAANKARLDLLADRLSDPKTLDALNRLLDRLDVIAFSVEALEGFIGRAQVVADSVAQGLAQLRQAGGGQASTGEMLTKLPRLVEAGARFADLGERPEVARLLDSGLIETLAEPGNVEGLKSLCRLGRTLQRAQDELRAEGEKPPLGLLGLVRALREPEARRLVELALRVAERYDGGAD